MGGLPLDEVDDKGVPALIIDRPACLPAGLPGPACLAGGVGTTPTRLRMGGSSSGTGGVGLEEVEEAGVVEAMP